MRSLSLTLTILLAAFSEVPKTSAGESKPRPRAARSVHLAYEAPTGIAFYNEVTVEASFPGTYFSVCGFRHGYFGIQELTQGRAKVVIFSVWDPGQQNDPKSVEKSRRVEVLHRGEGVRVRRFGGEGTGGQSFYTYDWKPRQTYRFLVRAERRGPRTAYSAYFYLEEHRSWKHLVTFSTLAGGDLLHGYYAFVEDFRRDGKSFTERRRASFRNGWVQTEDGVWKPLTRARFTADGSSPTNIDAGVEEGRFYLETGGSTQMKTKLWSRMDLERPSVERPRDLPSGNRRSDKPSTVRE